MFDLKAEPKSYEEMVERAKQARRSLGLDRPPQPVQIKPPPPPPMKKSEDLIGRENTKRSKRRNEILARMAADEQRIHVLPLPMLEVVRDVSERRGVPVALILGQTRVRLALNARLETYYLLRELGYSFTEIGRHLKRDHSTIIHGVAAHAERISCG